MTHADHRAVAEVAAALEASAANLPIDSRWRGRMLRDAEDYRIAACLPTAKCENTVASPVPATGLRLVDGGGART